VLIFERKSEIAHEYHGNNDANVEDKRENKRKNKVGIIEILRYYM